MSEVTRILRDIEQGDANAASVLLTVVYDELHRMASKKLAAEAPGHTLQTTALIHEAYLRLLPPANGGMDKNDSVEEQTPVDRSLPTGSVAWKSRAHFFASAAEAMRRILIDNARHKGRLKRGGDRVRVDFDGQLPVAVETSEDLLALNEALSMFEEASPQKAEIVKLRYFAGLTLEEVAEVLGVSVPTVHRHWRYARAWLKRQLEDE